LKVNWSIDFEENPFINSRGSPFFLLITKWHIQIILSFHRPSPFFFFIYCRFAFSEFGGGWSEKEKKRKNKIGKGVWSLQALYLSIISVEPENNKV